MTDNMLCVKDSQVLGVFEASEPLKLYMQLIGPLRAKARELGYALAVHGSLQRDIDLIAIPWKGEPVPPKELAYALMDVASAVIGHKVYQNPTEINSESGDWFKNGCQPFGKAHCRYVWTFYLSPEVYVDLSVMPRQEDVLSIVDAEREFMRRVKVERQ